MPGRASWYAPSAYGMTVARPSFPPYRVMTTRVRSPGERPGLRAVARISVSVYAVPPATSAPAPTTPLVMRNFRLVNASTLASFGWSENRVLGTDQPHRDQLARVAGGRGKHGPGAVGPGVHDEQAGE